MGSKSRSNSSQTTNNTSTTFGIQGPNNGAIINGNGNTVIDGGAFDLVGKVAGILPDVFKDSIYAVNQLSDNGARQTESVMRSAVDLFGDTNQTSVDLAQLNADTMTETGEILSRGLQDSYSFGESALNAVTQQTDNVLNANSQVTIEAMNNNTDLAALVTDALADANDNYASLSSQAMTTNSDLALGLSNTAIDAVAEARRDSTGELQRGFESFMGFAEQYSRSDSVEMAKANNKTMIMSLTAAAVISGLAIYARRK
ncbi:hypothetical protein [Shewanella marina]|uniref:hypothetical protein n=1 Tax=Shewanella marina TaxID=487319 RepID=UPI0004728A7E|nr:hypothetical protein [Shewanella marina]